MFDATGGGVNVSAGVEVRASGVDAGGDKVSVAIKVDVAGAGKVGVGGAGLADAQPVSNTNPIMIERVLIFICSPLLTIISPAI
jgi:hypothetical protein